MRGRAAFRPVRSMRLLGLRRTDETMATWVDEYMTMVEDCEKRESKLTEWEAGFVDSIRHRLEKEQPLSAKQTETLDKIWERVTARG